MEELISIIKYEREKKQLSQRDLSKLTGIPQSHISKIEAGEVDFKVNSLIALMNALGLNAMLMTERDADMVDSVRYYPENDEKSSFNL